MAFGNATFSDAAGAVNDIFGQMAQSASLSLKAEGDAAEAQNYDLAAKLAGQNEKFTEQSTAVKSVMADRSIYQSLGTTQAQIGAAGFQESGSALDILRSSASQGALQKGLIAQQGSITEAGYTEQQQAYTNLANYARMAASADSAAADSPFGYITGGVKAAASVATLFP